MSTFIEARVIQKVDTEANWMANPLKLYQGEVAFVSDKYNFKLNTTDIPKTFAELEYYYKGDIIGGVLPTDDLASKPDGVYRATISGTYGGVVVKEGYYTLLRKTAGVWSLESEVKMPMQDLETFEDRITDVENRVDDFIENFSGNSFEIKYDTQPVDLRFNKNYAYDLYESNSNLEINLNSNIEENKIGNICVLKVKGGNVSFGSDIILDSGSDEFNPNIGNIIYVIWEYKSARAVIKNSNNNSLLPPSLQRTFYDDFNIPDTTFNNWTPLEGVKPTIKYGNFNIQSNELKTLNIGDNGINFQLKNSNKYEFTLNVKLYNIFLLGFNNSTKSNVNINFVNKTVNHVLKDGTDGASLNFSSSSNSLKIKGVYNNGLVSLFINDILILSNVELKESDEQLFIGFYNVNGITNGSIDSVEIKEYI